MKRIMPKIIAGFFIILIGAIGIFDVVACISIIMLPEYIWVQKLWAIIALIVITITITYPIAQCRKEKEINRIRKNYAKAEIYFQRQAAWYRNEFINSIPITKLSPCKSIKEVRKLIDEQLKEVEAYYAQINS